MRKEEVPIGRNEYIESRSFDRVDPPKVNAHACVSQAFNRAAA